MNHWLLKSEPDTFGVQHLQQAPRQRSAWDGVRNFQARNYLREMKVGDLAFFYHSSCPEPGIAGIVKISREAFPDPSAFDPKHAYYDEESDPKKPKWYAVEVELEQTLDRVITLDELRAHAADALKDMIILRRGNRLSVTPVSATEWRFISTLM
jgi:predicted RNA-binding protein with PUA-like domain